MGYSSWLRRLATLFLLSILVIIIVIIIVIVIINFKCFFILVYAFAKASCRFWRTYARCILSTNTDSFGSET
jgi:hypothetical protein